MAGPGRGAGLRRHLLRHGYLDSEGRPGPLGLLLLDRLAARWRRHVQRSTALPLLAGRPADAGAEAARRLLTAAGRQLGCRPPLGFHARLCTPQRPPPPGQVAGGYGEVAPASDRLLLYLSVPADGAQQWLQTLQRTRRIWWRQLATSPGSFSCSQPTAAGADVLFKDSLLVERLTNHGVCAAQGGCLLSCVADLDAALWAVCDDALDSGTLRLAEALAPFQRAVLLPPNASEELRALAAHVTQQLCQAGVSVHPLSWRQNADCTPADDSDGAGPDGDEQPDWDGWQGAQLRRADAAGVVHTVLLSEESLRSGVCRLRSRDTGLCRQLHVSQLTADAGCRQPTD